MMKFGVAAEFMSNGSRIARQSWAGTKWIWLQPGSQVTADKIWSPVMKKYAESLPDQTVTINAYIAMKKADGTLLMGWQGEHTDIMAEDWEVVVDE